MKDFHATLSLRNNHLRARREALGLNQRQIADAAGVEPGIYGELETMKRLPVTRPNTRDGGGNWTIAAKRLAAFYNVLPEDLFPDAVLALPQAKFERELDAGDLPELLAPPLTTLMLEAAETEDTAEMASRIPLALATLTPREQYVLRQRFRLDTGETTQQPYHAIGADMGISTERVRQIELKALRKLRTPQVKAKITGEKITPVAVKVQPMNNNAAYVRARAALIPEAERLAQRERCSVTEAVDRLWKKQAAERGEGG